MNSVITLKMKMNDKIYTVDALCDLLQVSRRYLEKQVKGYRLQSYKVGNRRYFLHSDVITYIKRFGDASIG